MWYASLLHFVLKNKIKEFLVFSIVEVFVCENFFPKQRLFETAIVKTQKNFVKKIQSIIRLFNKNKTYFVQIFLKI